jgi:hypothetical protein
VAVVALQCRSQATTHSGPTQTSTHQGTRWSMTEVTAPRPSVGRLPGLFPSLCLLACFWLSLLEHLRVHAGDGHCPQNHCRLTFPVLFVTTIITCSAPSHLCYCSFFFFPGQVCGQVQFTQYLYHLAISPSPPSPLFCRHPLWPGVWPSAIHSCPRVASDLLPLVRATMSTGATCASSTPTRPRAAKRSLRATLAHWVSSPATQPAAFLPAGDLA